MKFSDVQYDLDEGTQRVAKPMLVGGMFTLAIAIAYVLINIVTSGYILKSPYADAFTRYSGTAPVVSDTNTQPPSSSPDNLRDYPAIMSSPSIASASPVLAEAAPETNTSVVERPVTPASPQLPELPDDNGGVVPVPEPEVPCLCGVSGTVNQTVDTVTDLVPVQLFSDR